MLVPCLQFIKSQGMNSELDIKTCTLERHGDGTELRYSPLIMLKSSLAAESEGQMTPGSEYGNGSDADQGKLSTDMLPLSIFTLYLEHADEYICKRQTDYYFCSFSRIALIPKIL